MCVTKSSKFFVALLPALFPNVLACYLLVADVVDCIAVGEAAKLVVSG